MMPDSFDLIQSAAVRFPKQFIEAMRRLGGKKWVEVSTDIKRGPALIERAYKAAEAAAITE